MTKEIKPPKPFVLPVRVYYEDTDAAGIVYHANHVKFAERGRTELLRHLGYDHKRVMEDFGLLLIVKHITIDYKAPAKLDDRLEIHTSVTTFGNTSLTMAQNILRDETIIAELKVTVVAINEKGRPERIPPQLRQIFEAQEP